MNLHPGPIGAEEVVAGAGFEPAIRQLPDYEPAGGVKPIIL
jgi:hypothetical protein